MCYKIPCNALNEQGWTPVKVSKDKLDSYYVYCQDEHLLEILIQKYIVNQISS